MQSQRFALQELLKQFLLMHHYCTSIFLFHKQVKTANWHFSYMKSLPISCSYFLVFLSLDHLMVILTFDFFYRSDSNAFFSDFLSLYLQLFYYIICFRQITLLYLCKIICSDRICLVRYRPIPTPSCVTASGDR